LLAPPSHPRTAADATIEDLARAVRQRQAILFAGAGVSMAVGLPSWKTLIGHMARELGLDPGVADDPATNYFTLAEYYRLTQGSIGPLRSWMDRHWSIPEAKLRGSRVHELIVRLDFPIIYTTNFDRNLESAFHLRGREFVKIVNAKDVARIRDGVTQIVKLHGDFDDDQSIVIAETDYLDRLSFESPLDIKFRADALGKTILFVGYSMSDLNIRFVLHRLWKTWRASGHEKDRPQSYVFMLRPSPIDQTVLEQWGIRVLSEPDCRPQEALESFLEKLATTVDQPGERETNPLTPPRARPRREPRTRARARSSAPGS
jgi:SIR2-like domain